MTSRVVSSGGCCHHVLDLSLEVSKGRPPYSRGPFHLCNLGVLFWGGASSACGELGAQEGLLPVLPRSLLVGSEASRGRAELCAALG